MRWLLYIYSIICSADVWAQNSVTYTIKAGVDVKEVIKPGDIYRYPSFMTGTVVFRDGQSSVASLNYNALISEMQFITPKGDTLSLANEATIRHIIITNDTFYFNEGYIRSIRSNGSAKVGEKITFREYVQKPGAYGLSTATTATNTVHELLNQRSISLETSQELVLVKTTAYFIGDRFNAFAPADKKNIFRMFPRQKKTIEEYLDQHEVNFNKADDLVKMIEFLGGL